ncbi:MAG: hypothetical protein QW407_05145 [Thermofilaceae archaeon]
MPTILKEPSHSIDEVLKVPQPSPNAFVHLLIIDIPVPVDEEV